MGMVGDLQKLHEKYSARGLRVVAVSDEPTEDVAKTMRAKGATFWIGIDGDQKTLRAYSTRGTRPLPQFYLVDVEGKVVHSKRPTEAQIEALLEKVMIPELGRKLHTELDAARAFYERDVLGRAWLETTRTAASKTEQVATDTAFLRKKIKRYAAWQRARIEAAITEKRLDSAMAELVVFEARFAGLDDAAWAEAQIKTLAKSEGVQAQRFAWGKLRKALAKEVKGASTPGGLSKGARKSVAFAYAKIVTKHADSTAAKIAQQRIDALAR
jgi:hypothetical protein